MRSKELIKGTLRVIVLKLLSENTRMYGYEITQRVKDLTNNEIELNWGALYPTLHKLESEGLVTTKSIIIDNRTRKYYTLTGKGGKSAKMAVKDYFTFAHALNLLLKPQ
jgi:DNA-binding PadR family transcriptional regulator